MSETSRYLALERQIRKSANRRGPGCLLPAEADQDGWTGTAERLRPSEDVSPPVARATSVVPVVSAFDDGSPIELCYQDDDFGPSAQARGETATPESAAPASAAPNASIGPASAAGTTQPARQPADTPVSPRAAAPPPAAAQLASAAELAAIDDDADFAQRMRELVDTASAQASTESGASAQTSPEPTPAPMGGEPAPGTGAAPTEENRYGIFDRIGEALASPRTFDLGSVPVTTAFDAIEQAMDRNQRTAPRPFTQKPPPALDDLDLVEDFALMPTALAGAAPVWIGYTPASPDTLLIGQREVPMPAGVTVHNWASPGVGQFASKSTRALSDVRQIVIHETVSDVWKGIAKPGLGVQLHLDRDGTLVQHNDVLDMLWHVKTFSPHSVGIEVVNLVFDADAAANPGEPQPGDRIPITWGAEQGGYYVVPPAAQMEALAQTIHALRQHLAVPDAWLQVIPHPDPARAAGDLKGRTFFLLRTAGHRYFTAVKSEPWIASHSVLRDHEDGAFPTLYCYLRLHKEMAPADAYQMARQIVEDPAAHRLHTHHDARTGAKLQLLDITDIA